MTFPVVGSNIPSVYQISNSLRFNDGDSPKLEFTPSSTGNNQTFTFSFWFKRGNLGGTQSLFYTDNNGSGSTDFLIFLSTSDQFSVGFLDAPQYYLRPSMVLRDTSAWYHAVVSVDTTQATASNRLKVYINGIEPTDFAIDNRSSLPQNTNLDVNKQAVHRISGYGSTSYFDGYIAEYYFIDGQALSPTDFGEFDEDSGVWKPKQYAGTYGTNGFYLKFNNTGNMGEDSSGNDNTWTPTNLSGTTDVTTDTPTNNFATLNALDNYYANSTFSEGNVKISQNNNAFNTSTMKMSSGKWYWEAKLGNTCGYDSIGITQNVATSSGQVLGNLSTAYGMRSDAGQIITNNSGNSYGVSFTSGDIIGVGLDLDNNKLYFSKNGTWMNSADPSAGTGGFSISAGEYFAGFGKNDVATGSTWEVNFGNPNFSISSGNSDANGYGNMEYSFPTNYLALCTQNLATELSPTIDDGSQYFNTVLWSGNSVDDRSITGVGFAPDLVSIKQRNFTGNFYWYDTTRGADNQIISNATNAEQTITNKLQAFESDGFQLGTSSEVNGSTYTYAGWSWKANGGTTSSNTDGTITSTVQANTTAGFSIITYTGTGASGSVGHGLTKAPEMVICKQRTDAGTQWQTGHTGLTNWTYKLLLNDTAAQSVNANVFPSAPTSTVINLGLAGDSNGSGKSQLIYAFHSVEGYSKFGKYTGNGSTDGTYIHLGFRPAFVMVKVTSRTGDWIVEDATRSTFNPVDDYLRANGNNAEVVGTSSAIIDFLSNGFKCRANGFVINESSASYIYMAFAENPFVTSGAVPVTAR